MNESIVGSDNRSVDRTAAAPGVSDVDVLLELEILEERVQEAVKRIAALRQENAELDREVAKLQGERTEIVARLSRLVEKVDSLGVGL